MAGESSRSITFKRSELARRFFVTTTLTKSGRERELRKQLKVWGWELKKDRAKAPNLDHQGGYMIIEGATKATIAGSRYDLTLFDVASCLLERYLDALNEGKAPIIIDGGSGALGDTLEDTFSRKRLPPSRPPLLGAPEARRPDPASE